MAVAAAGLPGVGSLAVLAAVDPAALSPSDLVDAVITAERLLAYVNALQTRLLAELGRPHRCGDVTALVAALVDKAGQGRGPDGLVDPVVVAELTCDRSIGVAATEVAAVLDWSPVTAKIRIGQSMRLETALPRTLDALWAGRVDVGRVRMIVDRTAVLSPQVCRQVERRILRCVKGRSKARLETIVDREVILADPAAAEHRRVKAVADRGVTHRPDRDGMGIINALVPAEAAVMVFTLIDLIADANKGLDARSVDQRRADAVADIAQELLTFGFVDLHGLIARAEHATATDTAHTGPAGPAGPAAPAGTAEPDMGERTDPDDAAPHDAAPHDAAPAGRPVGSVSGGVDLADRAGRWARALSRHGRRPHLNVTGAWSTVIGWDDLPGQLDGHGVITAQLLRQIAVSWGTLTAVGVDPVTGTATAVGALTYRPGQQLCDQVVVLSGTCRMAGCAMPAWKCDIDHLDPFDHQDPTRGGKTLLCNSISLCTWHHLLKHHTDWTPQLQPDLSIRWTTNTGHHAISHPREFTLPGEWLRPPPSALAEPGVQSSGEKTAPDRVAGPADTEPDETRVIIGPTVFGPTIPVVPAGADWIEPNTELEDPATIPHPGSVEITTYRILRRQSREHSLRRLATLRTALDPVEQRKRDFIAGKQFDTDGHQFDPADFDAATREKADLTETFQIAALLERSRRRRKALPQMEVEPDDATCRPPAVQPSSDEPPF
ncbi:DUF222 domain-containing protein [Nakamurella sp. PAMC28650]|uniref:DUF222 domain-containing protein n=1 Tax=Nakamurella sp. PAMC28650 TaxID=2762325 RepID=UPI00164DA8EE|nr:DUF222 domain-containing protein [Nakamurella sp. PAMC28650]QNK79574.1 DUF222 domain-containing protein [Nakamurella sp. PAMC28650]